MSRGETAFFPGHSDVVIYDTDISSLFGSADSKLQWCPKVKEILNLKLSNAVKVMVPITSKIRLCSLTVVMVCTGNRGTVIVKDPKGSTHNEGAAQTRPRRPGTTSRDRAGSPEYSWFIWTTLYIVHMFRMPKIDIDWFQLLSYANISCPGCAGHLIVLSH